MPNTYVNKVVKSDGTTLIDLTSDTVTSAAHIVSGRIGHLADGSQVTGTATESVEGTYMFPLEQNNDGIYVPTITDFSEVAVAQDEQFLMLYGYNVAGGVFTYAAYYENYEGYSECLTYGYTVDFSDSDTGGDTRNYGKASVYVTYGYYNGVLKTDYVIYKDAYNTSSATATADKILSGYTAFGPNGIIDGTASGGTNVEIGIGNTPIPNILNLFYALEKGTAVTGEFTLAQSIPNSSTLIFSTGLSTVHGIFIADESMSTLQTSTTPDNTLWAIVFNPTSNTGSYAMTRTTLGMAYGTNQTGVNRGFLNRVSSWSVTNGDLYVTGSYNRNNNYTPFYPGRTYRWVAW